MSVVEELKQQTQIEQAKQQRAYQVLQNEKSMPVKMWTNGVMVDDNSKKQLQKLRMIHCSIKATGLLNPSKQTGISLNKNLSSFSRENQKIYA